MPVLCEGTSRMTRAASDCTSEHGKNYFDSRLMSDIAIFYQLRPRQRRWPDRNFYPSSTVAIGVAHKIPSMSLSANTRYSLGTDSTSKVPDVIDYAGKRLSCFAQMVVIVAAYNSYSRRSFPWHT